MHLYERELGYIYLVVVPDVSSIMSHELAGVVTTMERSDWLLFTL
jgi:hypothetical protein